MSLDSKNIISVFCALVDSFFVSWYSYRSLNNCLRKGFQSFCWKTPNVVFYVFASNRVLVDPFSSGFLISFLFKRYWAMWYHRSFQNNGTIKRLGVLSKTCMHQHKWEEQKWFHSVFLSFQYLLHNHFGMKSTHRGLCTQCWTRRKECNRIASIKNVTLNEFEGILCFMNGTWPGEGEMTRDTEKGGKNIWTKFRILESDKRG